MDRGKQGTTRHLVVNAQGLPLLITHSAANVHDSLEFESLIAALQAVKQPSDYRRKRPGKVHTDKGYDFDRCRAFLRRWGITPRVTRRLVHRWPQAGEDAMKRFGIATSAVTAETILASLLITGGIPGATPTPEPLHSNSR